LFIFFFMTFFVLRFYSVVFLYTFILEKPSATGYMAVVPLQARL